MVYFTPYNYPQNNPSYPHNSLTGIISISPNAGACDFVCITQQKNILEVLDVCSLMAFGSNLRRLPEVHTKQAFA